MNILALDFGNACGWAHSCGISGVWRLKPQKEESDGIRLIKFSKYICKIYKWKGLDLVVFEAVRKGGINNRGVIVLAELQGVVKNLSALYSYEYKGYSSTEIKKFATGNGRASKEDMVKASTRLCGKIIKDHNEADAICLLHLAFKEFGT